MRYRLFSWRSFTLVSLLLLTTVIAACGAQPSQPTEGNTGLGSDNSALTPTATSDTGTQNNQSGSTDNWTAYYAGVEVTITSLEQIEDEYEDGSWLLRINLKESNKTEDTAYLDYYDWRLSLPDGKKVEPAYFSDKSSYVESSVTRENWIDFTIGSKQEITNQFVLHIGSLEKQTVDIALDGSSDLSRYHPKTISLNTKFDYAGAHWTLVSVTSEYSAYGTQVEAGKRYITLEFKVDNPTSNSLYIGVSDYMRLSTNGETLAPDDYTLENYVNANVSGHTGTVRYLVADGEADMIQQFLARPDDNIKEASVNFKI